MASMFRPVPTEPPPSGLQRHIDDFHEFFRARGIRFGSADDLPPFVERLAADASFRDDIASLVRTVIYRERDGMSRLELVELVSTAIVGPQVENAEVPEVREGVRQVMGFVDGVFRTRWNPGGTKAAGGATDQPDLAVAPAAEATPAEPVQEPPHATTDLFYRARIASGAEPAEAIAAERVADDAAAAEPISRAQLSEDAPAEPALQTRSRNEAAPLALTTELAARRSRGWIWAGAICALLLAFCAGLLVHQQLLVPLRDVNQPYETPPAETAQQTSAPMPDYSRQNNSAATNRSRASRAPFGARTGSAAAAPPGANETRSAISRGAGRNEITEGKYPEATVERESRPSTAEENVQPRYMAPAMIGASPALMASHLVFAPPPEYPGLARVAHVQGRVLVEAVVSKNGQVIRAEAITGHRLLRNAAVREVYERRYRPYLLNDRPTDVATVVTVEFRLR